MRVMQESFDRIPAAQLQTLGLWALIGSGIVNVTGKTGDGVTGTAGATLAQNTLRTLPLAPLSAGKGYHGFALKCVTLPVAERKVWALRDTGGGVLVTLTVRPDGKVSTYRGTFESGTLLGTSAAAFTAAAAFRYLQVGFDFGSANSLLVLSTNAGVTSLLSAMPGLTSPLPWSSVEFYLDELLVLDDFYANDGATSTKDNYFSGETSLVTLGPVGTVSTLFGLENFHPNTGSDKAAVTDDLAPDFDATYLYTRDDFSYLLYQMETLPDDGLRVDEVRTVLVSRAVSSDWSPNFGAYLRLWNGVATFSGRVALTWTGYLAQPRLLKTTTVLASDDWTIARVNDSRFGMASTPTGT